MAGEPALMLLFTHIGAFWLIFSDILAKMLESTGQSRGYVFKAQLPLGVVSHQQLYISRTATLPFFAINVFARREGLQYR
jgi:hypothetical protein